jgi:hypothetical protein
LTAGKLRLVLIGLLLVWLAAAASPLAEQFAQTSRIRSALAGKSADDRTASFDNPAFQAAQDIAQAVPAEGCVLVLAYAGPDAVTYYQARFRYWLYPRRVHVASSSSASLEGCDYLAVFRDSAAHLRESVFAGSWDEPALQQRLRALRRVAATDFVNVYALP